jgi:hypothetical protein
MIPIQRLDKSLLFDKISSIKSYKSNEGVVEYDKVSFN